MLILNDLAPFHCLCFKQVFLLPCMKWVMVSIPMHFYQWRNALGMLLRLESTRPLCLEEERRLNGRTSRRAEEFGGPF